LFVFTIFFGRQSSRYGKRKILILSLLFGIVYPLIYATSYNIFQYIIGRAAWAVSASMTGVMVSSLFQDLIRDRNNIAELAGWGASLNSITGTFGAITGGVITDISSPRITYLLIVLLYLIVLYVFINFDYSKYYKEFKPIKKSSKLLILKIINNPLLFLRIFLEGITQAHWVMEPILFPLIIFSMAGSNMMTGIVFGLMGIVAMIVLPFSGRWIDKKSPEKGYVVSFIFVILGFIILGMSSKYIFFVFGAMILSIGKAFFGPASTKIETINIRLEERDEILSYIRAYDILTAAVAGLLLGVMLNYFEPRVILYIFSVFTFFGGIVGYSIYRSKSKILH
jgi:MFS family permease